MTDYLNEDDDDTEFMMAFGGRRGANKAKKLAVPAFETTETENGSSSPRLRMPERVIAREARKHHKAVNTLLRRGDTARSLALDGLTALEQSDSVGTTLKKSSTTDDDNDAENNEESEAGGVESLDSEDGSDERALLDQAFSQAIAAEAALSSQEDTTSSTTVNEGVNIDAVLRSWAVCYGLADRMLQRASSTEESDGPARAMMASLSHQARYFERQGKLRSALEALDKAVELSKKTVCDAAMLRGVSSLLKSAGKVCQRLGSIEAMHKRVLKAVDIDDFLESRGEKTELPQQQQKAEHIVQKDNENKKKETTTKNLLDGAQRKASESTSVRIDKTVDKPTTSPSITPNAKKTAAEKAPSTDKTNEPIAASSAAIPEASKAAPPQAPTPISSLPFVVPTAIPAVASDGSANSLFISAAKSAMFQQDFQQLLHLLNRALLGDTVALDALWLSMPVANVTLLMVAASSDRSDLVKRLLGLLPVKEVHSKIVKEKDVTGSNAIAHACTLGRSASLDALLRRLHASKPVYTPFAPTSGGPLEAASLNDLGLSLQQAQSYSPLLQAQLRFFVADPEAYTKTTAVVPTNGVWSAPLPQLITPVVTLPMILAQQQAFLSNLLTMSSNTTTGPTQTFAPTSSSSSSSYIAPDAPSLPPPPASFLSPRSSSSAKSTTSSKPTPTPTSSAHAKTATKSAAPASDGSKAKNAKDRIPPVLQAIPQLTPNVSKAAGEGKLVGRKLVAWTNDDSNSNGVLIPEGELLDGGVAAAGDGGKSNTSVGAARFDQFKVNEEKFGLKASFDETQYTTHLDESKFTKEQIESADRLAAEIKAMESADASNNPHVRDERGQAVAADDDDEEALYSAVLGNRDGGGGGRENKDSFTDSGVSSKSQQQQHQKKTTTK